MGVTYTVTVGFGFGTSESLGSSFGGEITTATTPMLPKLLIPTTSAFCVIDDA
ncbi:MAG: hypothetical protein RJB29_617, partial [Actinomycetota bacterium]